MRRSMATGLSGSCEKRRTVCGRCTTSLPSGRRSRERTTGMYDSRHLKRMRSVLPDRVQCPVVGCSRIVERQKRVFLREQRFRCAEHSIYISPSPYDHQDNRDNLFLDDDEDCNVLEQM